MPREATEGRTVTVQGVEVPKLGYGTWLVEGEDAYAGVLDALALGYRHVDTARAYGNALSQRRLRTVQPSWAPDWD